MEVASIVDTYTTILGWIMYDHMWDILRTTGIVFVPLFIVLAKNFMENWGEGGDEGAARAIRSMELAVISVATVVALACWPVMELKVSDLAYTPSCGAQPTVKGGNTGTLYDQSFNIGGEVAYVPVWWRAVMAVSAGLNNAAISTLPCKTNLRRLSYQLDNTRIADPELRNQMQLFTQDCFVQGRAKFFREHTSLPAGYAPDDIDWPGSQFFLDTPGYYDHPNRALADMHSRERIPGFPFDPHRDFEDIGTPEANGWGKPTCKQWWTDGNVGLRKRLLEQFDPNSKNQFENTLVAQNPDKNATDAQNELIKRLYAQVDVQMGWAQQAPSGMDVVNFFMSPTSAINPSKLLAKGGVALHATEQRASFYALQQAAPIGQSLILMTVYMCLPFVLVFSLYSFETMLMATIGIFAIRFLSVMWALATWLDNALTEGLGISWWKAMGTDQEVSVMIVKMIGGILYIGLPLVWLVILGWAGIQLGHSEFIGSMSNGIGKAAGGAVRTGADMATKFLSKRVGK